MEMSTTHAEYNNTCNKNYDSFATSVPALDSGRLERLTSLSTVRSQQAPLLDLAASDSETLEPVAILSAGIFVTLSHTTLCSISRLRQAWAKTGNKLFHGPPMPVVKKRSGDEAITLTAAKTEAACPLRPTLRSV
nr:hypothetical protein Iba_chr11eCG2780 [Ipomoea batatas]